MKKTTSATAASTIGRQERKTSEASEKSDKSSTASSSSSTTAVAAKPKQSSKEKSDALIDTLNHLIDPNLPSVAKKVEKAEATPTTTKTIANKRNTTDQGNEQETVKKQCNKPEQVIILYFYDTIFFCSILKFTKMYLR